MELLHVVALPLGLTSWQDVSDLEWKLGGGVDREAGTNRLC